MENENFNSDHLLRPMILLVCLLIAFVVVTFIFLLFQKPISAYFNAPQYSAEQLEEYSRQRELVKLSEAQNDWDQVENGIHVRTGLAADADLQLIISACTSCHSAQLITQNRATREGWQQMIVWMQASQGLPDLGDEEPVIINYLAKHYAPKEIGRRANLDMAAIEWYMLNDK